jgi:hypothetical protein
VQHGFTFATVLATHVAVVIVVAAVVRQRNLSQARRRPAAAAAAAAVDIDVQKGVFGVFVVTVHDAVDDLELTPLVFGQVVVQVWVPAVVRHGGSVAVGRTD